MGEGPTATSDTPFAKATGWGGHLQKGGRLSQTGHCCATLFGRSPKQACALAPRRVCDNASRGASPPFLRQGTPGPLAHARARAGQLQDKVQVEQGSHCSRGCIPSLLTARYMKEATVNSQDPAELPGDYKELPPQPPTPQDSENNQIFPVLSHKVLGLLLMQHELTDTPRRWDGQGGSYSVSAGSVRPKGWLPWVGEEPPRSHILSESGRSTWGVGVGVSIARLTQIQLHGTAVTGSLPLDSSAWGKPSKQGGPVTQKRCLVPEGGCTWTPEGCEGMRQELGVFKASRAPRCKLLWFQYFVTGIYLGYFLKNPVWAKHNTCGQSATSGLEVRTIEGAVLQGQRWGLQRGAVRRTDREEAEPSSVKEKQTCGHRPLGRERLTGSRV